MSATTRLLGRRASRLLRAYYVAGDHPMKLRLWRWLRRAGGYARLTIGYSRSGWISVDERDYLQNMILTQGEYEPEVWATLASFAIRDEVVWDVGANIGSLAIKALLDPRVSQVHAFEPDPEHVAILETNLAMNQGRWCLHRVALDCERKTRPLLRATFPHRGGSTLVEHPTHGNFVGTATVECRPADEMVFETGVSPPTLMKIDVEGWEAHVFDGAKRLLRWLPPKAIVFEADSDARGIMADRGLTAVLESFGYDVTWLRRPEGTIYHRENYLAVHRASVGPLSETVTRAPANDR